MARESEAWVWGLGGLGLWLGWGLWQLEPEVRAMLCNNAPCLAVVSWGLFAYLVKETRRQSRFG